MTQHSSTSSTPTWRKILCSQLVTFFSICHVITAQPLTWSDDVACIVFNACTPCHHKSGVASFSLTSYAEVYERRFQIQEAVLAKRMPPWMPDPHHQRFIDERHLDDADIKAIDDWVQGGAMAGNLHEQPEPPLLDLQAQIADPDLTLRVPKYVVPDLPDIDLYRCFVFDHNLSESRFISEIEIQPSDPSLVHHVILYQDPSGTSTTLDQNDPTPGYVCFGGIGSNEASMIAGWAPGAGPVKMPPGFGVKLDPHSKLVIQVHYPSGNAGKVDDTEINLKFVEKGVPSREIFIAPILNHFTSMLNGPLTIKAGQRKTFKQLFINPFQLTVTGIAPHAHLVCESMKAFGVTPGGDTLEFINIPHWDFEWQGYYQFQKPIIVPPGTAIYGEASYNNTSVNHHLPFDQPRDVHVGEATTDEMMVFFFGASDYVSGDEDLYFDTTDLRTTIASCQGSIVTDSPNFTTGKFSVHPNPSSGHFQIEGGPVLRGAGLQLHSLEGQVVYEKVLTGSTIEVEDLKGVYVARVVGHDGTYYPPFKLVLQ